VSAVTGRKKVEYVEILEGGGLGPSRGRGGSLVSTSEKIIWKIGESKKKFHTGTVWSVGGWG